MSVPYIFASATTSLPLSQLDTNFSYFADAITVSSGNVGIGTTSPAQRIHVLTTAAVSGTTQSFLRLTGDTYGADFGGGIIQGVGPIATISTVTAGTATERMRIDSSGNVGIGTSSPTYKLQLSTDSAAKPSTNTWTIASDERIKNVTGEYTKGLDAVCALRPITYEYNGAAGFEADGKENISIIAQEAIEHFPECVGTFNAKLNETDETETELYNWNGHALTFALVNAIKELKAELDTVKSELNALKNA